MDRRLCWRRSTGGVSHENRTHGGDMEELKMLVEMVAHLPAMAMWVLVGFFAYKVVVIGSVYGVIRFVTAQLFGWLTLRNSGAIGASDVRKLMDEFCVRGAVEPLMTQLKRLRGVNVAFDSKYIHESSVNWLRQAIEEKMERDSVRGKA